MSGSIERHPVLRVILAAIVAADLLSFFFILAEDRPIGAKLGTVNPFNDAVSAAIPRAVIVLVGLVAAVEFGRRPGRVREGAVALGALGVLSTAHAQLFGSPWRHLFYSGLCLAGWLAGLLVSGRRGAPTDETFARTGSIAFLSAAYFNAGISKLAYSGFQWLSGYPIQAVIVAQDGLVPDGLIGQYRLLVVETPALAAAFSILTVGFELAAPLMIAGRWVRAAVALGLFAFHANIFVLTPILYWESMVFLLVFGLSPEPPCAQSTPSPTAPARSGDRGFAVAAAVLALCAVLAVAHQSRRFQRSEAARMQQMGQPPPNPSVYDPRPPAPEPRPNADRARDPSIPAAASPGEKAPAPDTSIRRIGPFEIGQTLAREWTVNALELSEEGILVRLTGQPGGVAFEVTCASSPHRSPFDLAGAHIFYSSGLEFRVFEAAGRAVRKTVAEAAGESDVCGRVRQWRAHDTG